MLAAGDATSLAATLPETLTMIDDMIYKEEKILFPTALDVVTAEEWAAIAAGDAESATPGSRARAAKRRSLPPAPATAGSGDGGEMLLPLPTGALTLGPARPALPRAALRRDLRRRERPRAVLLGGRAGLPALPGAIGREVRNCHPPKSLHKVEEILAEFKAGEKDEGRVLDRDGPKFVHIRYFALRDGEGAYKGCLEVVHDATHVRSLEGNRRSSTGGRGRSTRPPDER